jgi:hypothetical protein
VSDIVDGEGEECCLPDYILVWSAGNSHRRHQFNDRLVYQYILNTTQRVPLAIIEGAVHRHVNMTMRMRVGMHMR